MCRPHNFLKSPFKTSRIQFSLPMRFLGGPGMLSRTSLASLDFFVMTSLSRNAVCMRRTSIWLLLKKTYSYNGFHIFISSKLLGGLVAGQVGNTYKFSHSLPQHIQRNRSTGNYTCAIGNCIANVTPHTFVLGGFAQKLTPLASAHNCSSQSRAAMRSNSRFHVEEVFGRLRVRCTDSQTLVCTFAVCPGGSAPHGSTGGSEASRTSGRGGLLTVDQLNLFRVGHSHRLRDEHRDVTA